ncbi:luciferin sulfotransferase-like [Neocloeon triangulifer]|uniref:luciferin sulfotransferase-like n=1 Tax=Neocloeon triangulifer TaxID=2078957 RepID=UPI00286F88CE|nr:luciferin sulfotransferase-like [Neocloeon triangulifer]
MAELKFNKLDGPLGQKVDDLFGDDLPLLEVEPGNILVPPKFQNFADRLLNMKVRPDDVWLVAYPRTGSSWMQEMVWCIGNNLNFQRAAKFLCLRAPVFELSAMLRRDSSGVTGLIGETIDLVERMPSPRFIKSYLPKELLPRQLETVKPKIIYMCRNPKEVAPSYYDFCRLFYDLEGPFEDFCELFLQNKVPMGPFWNHVLGFWKIRNEPNVLFLRQEKVAKDHESTVDMVSKFLGKDLTTEGREALLDHMSDEKIKANPSISVRPMLEFRKNMLPRSRASSSTSSSGSESGLNPKPGMFEARLTEDMAKRFDEWAKKNLEGTGLSFD